MPHREQQLFFCRHLKLAKNGDKRTPTSWMLRNKSPQPKRGSTPADLGWERMVLPTSRSYPALNLPLPRVLSSSRWTLTIVWELLDWKEVYECWALNLTPVSFLFTLYCPTYPHEHMPESKCTSQVVLMTRLVCQDPVLHKLEWHLRVPRGRPLPLCRFALANTMQTERTFHSTTFHTWELLILCILASWHVVWFLWLKGW